MRGIILAGGTGSRLGPLTRSVNKHALPVGGVPMIHHPLRVLTQSGIDDVTVVSSPRGVGQLAELLGSGAEHGCRIRYAVQVKAGGIAQALLAGWDSRSGGNMAVILGDNIFVEPPHIPTAIEWNYTEEPRAMCWLKKVESIADLRSFGVPVFAGERIFSVEEKPFNPKSQFAVCGLYLFDPWVRDALVKAKPSARGEVEITDVLDAYASRGELAHAVVDGFWGDAGTPEGLRECDAAVRGNG